MALGPKGSVSIKTQPYQYTYFRFGVKTRGPFMTRGARAAI